MDILKLNKKELNAYIKNLKDLIKIYQSIIKQHIKNYDQLKKSLYINDCSTLFDLTIKLQQAQKIKDIYY